MKKQAIRIPVSTILFLLLLTAALLLRCDCEESGAGDKTHDFSKGYTCLELISAMTHCGITLIDPPWTDIFEACEGQYSPYFDCIAEQYDPDGFCSQWLSKINSECATDQNLDDDPSASSGQATDDDDDDEETV